MAYVLIFLAVLALFAAGALWYADSRQRPHEPEHTPAPADNAAPAVASEPEAVPEPDLERAPEPAPEPVKLATSHRSSGLQLPGAARRERRAWAQAKGLEFSRSDELLGGEWTRGAAASGAVPKDIASGTVFGHDTHVMDLGGVTVMAMRTGEVSDIVVDFRRDGFVADSSADLIEVDRVEDFSVLATEAAPVQRFLDVRVHTALEQFPGTVMAAWCESEWVLAQTAKNSTPQDWDAMLAPLALLADAARVLPPRSWASIEFAHPTREMAAESGSVGGGVDTQQAAGSTRVTRPEEPRPMPTRTAGAVRGTVEPRGVGNDEVAPIAEELEDATGTDLTRVRRDQTPPSIFG